MAFLDTLKSLLTAGGATPETSGATARGGPSQGDADTETVRRIMAKLESLEPRRARWIAAFAYVLGRVAHADLEISGEETTAMERLVQEVGGLPEDQAVLVVGIAKSQNRLMGHTENYLVTRELKEIADGGELRRLLDCLFAVSAADDSISGAEESQIRQIASELGFSHRQYVEARSHWSEQREVLRGLRRGNGPP